MDALSQFIQSNPDPGKLKRALAVQMVQQNHKHREIQAILEVSSGFISKWTQAFEQQGVKGLQLRHIGSVGYLTHQQRQAVIDWLKQKNYWNLQELETHIEEHYEVVFESNQSYYARFAPNAPEQNPVEDIWLQAKRWIRECYHLCRSFTNDLGLL